MPTERVFRSYNMQKGKCPQLKAFVLSMMNFASLGKGERFWRRFKRLRDRRASI
jgi:hypothetical protein